MAPYTSDTLSWVGVGTVLFLFFMGAYLAGHSDGRKGR